MSFDFYQITVWNSFYAISLRLKGASISYVSLSMGMKILMKIWGLKHFYNRIFSQKIFSKKISEFEGKFYELQKESVYKTVEYTKQMNYSQMPIFKSFSRRFKTNKFEPFIKFKIQREVKMFLNYFSTLEGNGVLPNKIIVPNSMLFKIITDDLNKTNPNLFLYRGDATPSISSFILKMARNSMKVLHFVIRQRIDFNYRPNHQYMIGFRGHWPKTRGLLRTDFLMDGKSIHPQNLLFYVHDTTSAHGKRMAKVFKENGYAYVALTELKIPVSVLSSIFMDQIGMFLMNFIRALPRSRRDVFMHFLEMVPLLMESKFELLLTQYPLKVMYSFHSAGYEPMAGPILCDRHNTAFMSYNFGTTAFQAKLSDYAFGSAHHFLSWGQDVMHVYNDTHAFNHIQNVGFWGFEEYRDAERDRDKLRTALNVSPQSKLVVFYDCPYFPERSPFHPELLADFYSAVIKSAELKNVNVLLKMKSFANENLDIYPPAIRPLFEKIWKQIKAKENIHTAVTLDWDPLQVIAASDINVTLELSTPSSIALICGKPGLFLNTVEKNVFHPLFPKYKGQLIFENSNALVKAIEKNLNDATSLTWDEINKDLKGYNENGDEDGLNRIRAYTCKRAGIVESQLSENKKEGVLV